PNIDVLKRVGYYGLNTIVGFGILTSPVLLLQSLKPREKKSIVLFLSVFLLLIIFTALKIMLTGRHNPFTDNIFYQSGLGPIIMRGYVSYEIMSMSTYSKAFFSILSLLGILTSSLILTKVVNLLYLVRKNKNQGLANTSLIPLYIIVITVLYIAPILLVYASDRYILLLIPMGLLLFMITANNENNLEALVTSTKRKWMTLILFLFISFSTILVHDYISINRVKWEALNYLTGDLKILPEKIDGGFEFNGWYLFDFEKYKPDDNEVWWWVEEDNYVVSPALLDSYKKIKSYEVSNWNPFTDVGSIYIYQK
ncbi:hypothetical protein JYU23_01840, partial [bacterium AH-315-C07]|nr:hypothetical protein [bacterium AH-315-C07]